MSQIKPPVRLGFIPLIDCAPFVIAHELGFFEDENVDVELVRDVSWANIRDKLTFNLLDGAHMLASMPLASTLGLGSIRKSVSTGFTVSQNGNGITVSNSVYESMMESGMPVTALRSGEALAHVVKARKQHSQPLRFAVVYPYSSHNYQLRYWLSNVGISPDQDVQLIVLPPAQMLRYLEMGEIDGYCVGEPWNSLAQDQGIGQVLTTGYEIWGNAPEKVFGVRSDWANEHTDIHAALIRALNRACQWVSQPENNEALLNYLSQSNYLNRSPVQLAWAFSHNKPSGLKHWPQQANPIFTGSTVNQPNKAYAFWLLGQMARWQQLANPHDIQSCIQNVIRDDVYFKALNLAKPQAKEDLPRFDASWVEEVAQGRIMIDSRGFDFGFVRQEKH